MMLAPPPQDTGFEMNDLLDSPEFTQRQLEHENPKREQIALSWIAEKFSTNSEAMLQELVESAVEYCGADSAGVSLEESDGHGGRQFRWIAVAGSFEKYRNGVTPRNFSPCGVCLDRHCPQWYKVTQPYYDFLGVAAEPILDGMLIPWGDGTRQGTIWVVSHKSAEAFDMSDYMMMRRLSDVVSLAIRHLPKR